MESFVSELSQAINTAVNTRLDKIATKYNLPADELKSLWSSSSEGEPKVVAAKPTSSAKSVDEFRKCQYKYIKGKQQGEICGSKVSDDSSTGNFCKKHCAQESKSPESQPCKEKQEKPKLQKVSVKKEEDTPVVKAVQQEIPTFTIKRNKWKNYVHEGTNLAFDTNTKEVYGKQLLDGTVAPLTAVDVETATRMGFKFRLPPEGLVPSDNTASTSKDEDSSADESSEVEDMSSEADESD